MTTPRIASVSVFISATAALILASACGDDDDDTPTYQASCDRGCQRAHECTSTVDAADCAADCKEDLAAIGPNLRSDYVLGIDSCLGELSCNELAVASVLSTCQRESAARLSPSDTAVALCDAVVDSIRECSGLTVGAAGCLESVKIFSDDALGRGRACERLPCDQRVSCLRDELGVDLTPS